MVQLNNRLDLVLSTNYTTRGRLHSPNLLPHLLCSIFHAFVNRSYYISIAMRLLVLFMQVYF